MLDYSTIQVINPDMGLNPSSTSLIIWWIFVGVALALFVSIKMNNTSGGIFAGLFFLIACLIFSWCIGAIQNVALIKIEAKNIEISSNVYPSAKTYPYLQKEGDKIYYYDMISTKNIEDPYQIKKETEKSFEKILFNLKNSEPQEKNNADTIK